MTKRKYRNLGKDPITGEKIPDWETIDHNVAVTQAKTNIEHAQHAAETNVWYATTPITLVSLTDALLVQLATLQRTRKPW
jgi:hypothetical protein